MYIYTVYVFSKLIGKFNFETKNGWNDVFMALWKWNLSCWLFVMHFAELDVVLKCERIEADSTNHHNQKKMKNFLLTGNWCSRCFWQLELAVGQKELQEYSSKLRMPFLQGTSPYPTEMESRKIIDWKVPWLVICDRSQEGIPLGWW